MKAAWVAERERQATQEGAACFGTPQAPTPQLSSSRDSLPRLPSAPLGSNTVGWIT
jgi:hypothetical protein